MLKRLLCFLLISSPIAYSETTCRPYTEHSKTSLLNHLKSLQPRLSIQEIKNKALEAKNEYKFFRSFVALFYAELKCLEKTLSSKSELKKIFPFRSWVAGDPHFENFGSLLDKNGQAFFSINDYDDMTQSSSAADFLRQLTSASYIFQENDLKKLWASYKKGLQGKSHTWSHITQNLLKESEKKGREAKKSIVNLKEDRFERPSGTFEVSENKWKKIKAVLEKSAQMPLEVLDMLFVERPQGGSGGYARFLVLIKDSEHLVPGSKHIIVELKEIEEFAGPYYFEPIELLAAARVHEAYQLTHPPTQSKLYTVISLDGLDYMIRPLWKGIDGVEIKNIEKSFGKEALSSVLEDEAWWLGRLHYKSAQDPKSYEKVFSNIAIEPWLQSSQELKKRIEFFYKLLQD